MTRAYRHGNGRFQPRAGGGRFRRSTLADVGLAGEVCEACRGFNARELGAPAPETCAHCGAVFVYERCARTAKPEPRHLGPEDLADIRAGAFEPCGAPAVACQLEDHQPRCTTHLEDP